MSKITQVQPFLFHKFQRCQNVWSLSENWMEKHENHVENILIIGLAEQFEFPMYIHSRLMISFIIPRKEDETGRKCMKEGRKSRRHKNHQPLTCTDTHQHGRVVYELYQASLRLLRFSKRFFLARTHSVRNFCSYSGRICFMMEHL